MVIFSSCLQVPAMVEFYALAFLKKCKPNNFFFLNSLLATVTDSKLGEKLVPDTCCSYCGERYCHVVWEDCGSFVNFGLEKPSLKNGLFYGDLDNSVERAVQIIEACLVEFHIGKQKLCGYLW